MIRVDHAPGNPATIAERAYSRSKLARQLVEGDAIAVDFRGWGSRVMKVYYKLYRNEDDPTVTIGLIADGMEFEDDFDGNKPVVLYPESWIGRWLP